MSTEKREIPIESASPSEKQARRMHFIPRGLPTEGVSGKAGRDAKSVSRALKGAISSGTTASEIAQAHSSAASALGASSGFHFATLGAAVFDFVRIPLRFFDAYSKRAKKYHFLNLPPTDEEKNLEFEQIQSKLQGEDAFILQNNQLYFADIEEKKLIKIQQTANNEKSYAAITDICQGHAEFKRNDEQLLHISELTGRPFVKSPPMTRGLKWLYSGAVVGLTAASIALPALAPPLGIAVAGLVLIYSVTVLVQLFNTRSKLKKTNAKIAAATKVLEDLHQQTIDLEKKLKAAPTLENQAQLEKVVQDFDHLHAKLQTLHDQKFEYENQLKHFNFRLFKKAIGVGAASLGAAGVALTFVFPPAGLALIGISALLGLVGVIGHFVHAGIKKKAKKQAAQQKDKVTAAEPEMGSERKMLLELDEELKKHHEKALEVKAKIEANKGDIDRMTTLLSVAVQQSNKREVIDFYIKAADFIKQHGITNQTRTPFFNCFSETDLEKSKQLLATAEISNEDHEKLASCPALSDLKLPKPVGTAAPSPPEEISPEPAPREGF